MVPSTFPTILKAHSEVSRLLEWFWNHPGAFDAGRHLFGVAWNFEDATRAELEEIRDYVEAQENM